MNLNEVNNKIKSMQHHITSVNQIMNELREIQNRSQCECQIQKMDDTYIKCVLIMIAFVLIFGYIKSFSGAIIIT
jgi:hypothetical protein